MHVSDHSGFHYRQFLLKELLTELSQSPVSPSSSSGPQTNGDLSGAEAASEKKQLIFSTVHQLFHQEAELCSDLIQSFPGHETLWSHRWVNTSQEHLHFFKISQRFSKQTATQCSVKIDLFFGYWDAPFPCTNAHKTQSYSPKKGPDDFCKNLPLPKISSRVSPSDICSCRPDIVIGLYMTPHILYWFKGYIQAAGLCTTHFKCDLHQTAVWTPYGTGMTCTHRAELI